jgi:hypothetical protein
MRRTTLLTLTLGLLAGCGASQSTTPASEPETTASSESGSPGEDLTLADRMWRHFHDATLALDAVIGGDLTTARAQMKTLSERDFGDDLPGDWAPWVDDMQAEAKRGAEAADLDAAAKSIAAIGMQCAECHRATRGGQELTGDEAGYRHMRNTGLSEKMARHLWSAKELWLGMTGPVHQAWSRGGAALMNIDVPALVDTRGVPVKDEAAPTGKGTTAGEASDDEAAAPASKTAPAHTASGAVDLDAAMRDLHALGARADKAGNPTEKRDVFAAIVGRCASCHSELGITPQPTRHD